MHEQEIRAMLDSVREGRLARRSFIRRMVGLGLTAPMASMLMLQAGIAQTPPPSAAYKPVRRGGGGALKMLLWQAPTLLNPHFAVGLKDSVAANLFYESLAVWDRDGNLVPVLAAELPSVDNGGVARDGLSVTWKLKRGVSWHDGEPFTADDVVFTWEFARNPEAATFTHGTYKPVTLRKVDSHTVRVEFDKPTPFWADAALPPILPRRHFAAFTGSKSRDAAANLKPVGTGPYRFVEFRPGDSVRGELNPAYHRAARPHFDTVEIKGGGDAVSAARAVLQTGEYDYAWNMQVDDEVLRRLEEGGRGRMDFAPGGNTEFLMLNQADPWTELEGERAHPASRHPLLADPDMRQALAHLVDRESIQRNLYGRGGVATSRFLNNPQRYTSTRQGLPFDIGRANALLDAGGWVRGDDGIRSKGGRRLKLLFQTSVNAVRQKAQAVIKQSAQRAGIEIELKATAATVYFSSDVANPDTASKFYADLQMYQQGRTGPDPGRFLEMFCSWQVASKANKWEGRNVIRWRSDDYDRTFRAAEVELDPVKRAALLIRLNDIVCSEHAIIPIVYRPTASALLHALQAPISGWTIETAQIADWYRG